MKSDIEIAQAATPENITSIASKLDIPKENLIPYGHLKAKIDFDFIDKLKTKDDFCISCTCYCNQPYTSR